MVSRQIIKNLLQTSVSWQRELKKAYALLPATRCNRKTLCCSLLPEMTLAEALQVIASVANMSFSIRRKLTQRLIVYFFLNPVKITSCPFLDGQDCLIYAERFFGCRAYGIWSPAYYEKMAAYTRKAKTLLKKQWEMQGVSLPKKVLEFQTPYCLSVEIEDHSVINDKMLLQISNRIETISKRFSRWHHIYGQVYFLDLSFLVTSLIFGTTDAVRMKLGFVSDIISTGNRNKLDELIENLPDLFSELD